MANLFSSLQVEGKNNGKYLNRYTCICMCVWSIITFFGKQKTLGTSKSFVFSYCLFLFIFWPWGIWDLSFLIRDQTCTLCLGKEESRPLDSQRSPLSFCSWDNTVCFCMNSTGGGLLLQRSSLLLSFQRSPCSVGSRHISRTQLLQHCKRQQIKVSAAWAMGGWQGLEFRAALSTSAFLGGWFISSPHE